MAKFCGNCGAALEPGVKFCAKCGAPVGKAPNDGEATPVSAQNQSFRENMDCASQEVKQVTVKASQTVHQIAAQVSSNEQFANAVNNLQTNGQVAWYKKNLLHANGRMNRLRFLKYVLLNTGMGLLAWMVAGILGGLIYAVISEGLGLFLIVALGFVLGLPFSISNIMLSIRRIHDIGYSGWLFLIVLIPYIGWLFGILIYFVPGTVGGNQYGPDPLENER